MGTQAGKILQKPLCRLLDRLEMRKIIPASQHCGGTDPDLQVEPEEAATQKHSYVRKSVCVWVCVMHGAVYTRQPGPGKTLSSMAAGAHRQLVSVGG